MNKIDELRNKVSNRELETNEAFWISMGMLVNMDIRLSELEKENKKLKFIIDNGLGENDLENDCL